MLRSVLATLALLVAFATATPSVHAQGRSADLLRNNPRFLAAFRDAVADAGPAVARIRCDGFDTALGAIVAPDGYILTKAHDLQAPITCRLHDGRELTAHIVGVDTQHDLALLHVEATKLPVLELRDSKELRAGSWVAAPGLGGTPVAIGVVSVPTREVHAKPGTDPAKAAYLGVGLGPADEGVRVNEVIPGTAAVRAGLRLGDLILEVSGTPVNDPDDFVGQLTRRRAGDTITLRIRRDGAEQELRATLQTRPHTPRSDLQNRMGSELSSRRSGYAVILQHDSVLKPSDCGGPLVDLEGRVVGINISRAGRVETWAVPAEVVRSLLAELKSGKKAPQPATAAAQEHAARVDALLAAVQKRLQLMPDVARAKWNEAAPIHDPKREAALLDKLAVAAKERDVPAAEARRFFTAQMAAARQVQETLFAEWRRSGQGDFPEAVDLREVLRPAVERASLELLAALARLQPHLQRPEVQERLRERAPVVLGGEGITDEVRRLALEPLLPRASASGIE